MTTTLQSIAESWNVVTNTAHTTDDLLAWVDQRNKTISVEINKCCLKDCNAWFYDYETGRIQNKNQSFFSITGYKQTLHDGTILSQPIFLQDTIGYLGIICKKINGVMHFLMQAKIEPGNVNKIQISPTIQATKSNFTQEHGGSVPPYLEYFLNASQYEIVVDQIQSEQSSRFYKKRNRNIIIHVEEDIPVLPSHKWMTLGQIKQLMRQDNLVNMDTRTVLSCIPFSKLNLNPSELLALSKNFQDQALFNSVFIGDKKNKLPQVYQYINNHKMFTKTNGELIPLHELPNWEFKKDEISCNSPFPFKVIFCDIAIEGREVKRWSQPLFEANGVATFGLICCEDYDTENSLAEEKPLNSTLHENVSHKGAPILKFLVKATPEVGCFDGLELGPTVQREAIAILQEEDAISRFFFERLKSNQGIIFDHMLSEEGGRFYHEQNRNIIMRVNIDDLPPLPEGYFLLDFHTLNTLVQINNTLNIQLRNLLSLLGA